MSTNCVNNIARNGVKGIFNSKAGELLLRQVKRIPYIDAADLNISFNNSLTSGKSCLRKSKRRTRNII